MTVRKLEDLTDIEKLALIDISYSRLDTYSGSLGCKAKYFYSYITKEPRLFGAAATLGNVVHSTLEEKLEKNKVLGWKEAEEEFDNQLTVWDPDENIDEDLRTAGRVMLAEFVDRYQDDPFIHLEDKERPFAMVVGSALISGYIDRVDVGQYRVSITDYKTGKYEVAAKHIHNNLQLGIYALAMSLDYPDKDIYAELYYLRSGKQKGHLFTRDDLDAVEQRLVDAVSDLIDQQNFTPTDNPRVCFFCDHAVSGACAIGQRRIQSRR